MTVHTVPERAKAVMTQWWAERIVVDEGGCWVWQRALNQDGYGVTRSGGRMMKAHRVCHEEFVGAIPAGMELDHLCRVRSCVNPAHLEPVTHAENVSRGDNVNREKTECPHGHPYDEANTYTEPRGRGWRRCRACKRIRRSEYNARPDVKVRHADNQRERRARKRSSSLGAPVSVAPEVDR